MSIANSTQQALNCLYAVVPLWSDVKPAAFAVGLPDMTLLHAGPPFKDPSKPSAPIMSSAVLCCLYEGWTDSFAEAEQLIRDGRVKLLPAQNFNVVTPLAAVISPTTNLIGVSDANKPNSQPSWSLLGSGVGPQIRFGSRDIHIIDRMRYRDEVLAPNLSKYISHHPMNLLELAFRGVKLGDDLHRSTKNANQALYIQLKNTHQIAPSILELIESTPLFFLTLWMASCHLMLKATEFSDSSIVIAMAGNGQDVGIRLSRNPSQWIKASATKPFNELTPHTTQVSPAVGDSGVIDAAGFGAQAWNHSKEVANNILFESSLPKRQSWLIGSHPRFKSFNLGAAIDASKVSKKETSPFIAIAMIANDGVKGLIGKGVCQMPLESFVEEKV